MLISSVHICSKIHCCITRLREASITTGWMVFLAQEYEQCFDNDNLFLLQFRLHDTIWYKNDSSDFVQLRHAKTSKKHLKDASELRQCLEIGRRILIGEVTHHVVVCSSAQNALQILRSKESKDALSGSSSSSAKRCHEMWQIQFNQPIMHWLSTTFRGLLLFRLFASRISFQLFVRKAIRPQGLLDGIVCAAPSLHPPWWHPIGESFWRDFFNTKHLEKVWRSTSWGGWVSSSSSEELDSVVSSEELFKSILASQKHSGSRFLVLRDSRFHMYWIQHIQCIKCYLVFPIRCFLQ